MTGPDKALWFTGGGTIGRITTTGVVTVYPIPATADALGIATGPDRAIWFADWSYGRIGRVPACGLGMQLTTAHNALTIRFDLGIATPAVWKTWLTDGTGQRLLWSKPIEPVVPPQSFSVTLPASGNAVVESSLGTETDHVVCGEIAVAIGSQ